jgi:hypothetical protein
VFGVDVPQAQSKPSATDEMAARGRPRGECSLPVVGVFAHYQSAAAQETDRGDGR